MTRTPLEVSHRTERQWQAIVADAALLVASLFVLYTLFGGEVRWKTPFFRITLTEPNRPVQICVLVLLLKAVAGLDRGLFAALASSSLPVVGPVAALAHALDRRLRASFLAYRVPLLISAASLVLSLALLEVYLRYLPQTLPHALANHVATPYDTGPSGIYHYAPELRTRLMHPNEERTMYFNGYRWHHRTDSRGFRNPVERATASVVLLGDSIVYGHGVEETSTIRHHLETILGQPVANLGIQGSSIHDEYQVLKAFGLSLRPRYVFLFFLANDIGDLRRLTEREMSAFLQTPVADHSTPYFEIPAPRTKPWSVAWSQALDAQLEDLYVVKAWGFLRDYLRARLGRPAEASEDVLSSLPPIPGGIEVIPAMRFHLHALRKVQNLADRNHFQFVNVFAYTGVIRDESAYEKVLEAFCRRHGIAFLSLRPAFEGALRDGVDLFLKDDGHLADSGARLAAEALARYVDQHPTPASGS
jgi:lysophospholipase L1-like esterase